MRTQSPNVARGARCRGFLANAMGHSTALRDDTGAASAPRNWSDGFGERCSKHGLRRRLASASRRLGTQHACLHALYDQVAECLEDGLLGRVQAPFRRFRDALEAHLRIQDQLVLPAVRGLRPALAPDVEELARAHEQIRSRLDVLRDCLETGRNARFKREIRKLARTLSKLERREEALVHGAECATREVRRS